MHFVRIGALAKHWNTEGQAVILLVMALLTAPIPQELAIRAIVGEAEDQGAIGMQALAEALYNRGTVKGVYGAKAVTKRADGYYRGSRRISPKIIKLAEKAWLDAPKSQLVHGADHWENVRAFGVPYWAKSMKKTAKIKDHQFYKGGK